jgi:hypothetical protein
MMFYNLMENKLFKQNILEISKEDKIENITILTHSSSLFLFFHLLSEQDWSYPTIK